MKITLKQKKELVELVAQANGKKTKAISKIQKMRPSLSFPEAKMILENMLDRAESVK